jgi:hypothetical protein
MGNYRKSEIERSYHNGTQGLPMVNVKQHNWHMTDKELAWLRGDYPWLPANDTEARNLLDDAVEANDWVVDAAREQGWDDLQADAEQAFDDQYVVKVWSAGRSGGWAVVEGLPDVDGWDAIAVAKWAKFAKWARGVGDGIASQTAWLVCANVLEPMHREAEAADDAAAELPVLVTL